MFNEEREVVKINRVKALVKDIKVTSKGIQVNFENVLLTGEQISLVSALVSNPVWLDIEERLPESKKKELDKAEGQTSFFDDEEEFNVNEANEPEVLTDADISAELGINIVSGQQWVRAESEEINQKAEV